MTPHPALPSPRRPQTSSAFTLIELLAVVAVVALLAGMLVPTLARARSKAAEAGCRNNLRQLGLAMMLYLPDNLEVFPCVASRDAGGPTREDWVFWNVNRTGVESYFLNPRNSAIGPYLSSFNTKLFRCPTDRDVLDREAAFRRDPTSGNPYLYSYALTSLANPTRNRGIGSVYARDQAPLHFYSHRVINPDQKLMLVEDNGDPLHAELLTGDPNRVIDDGRWVPTVNALSARHRYGRGQAVSKSDLLNRGRGVVQFADGHVDILSPARARLTIHCDPSK
jgi:prepilin-type N-terminal cleavage/methylation domain-containing protein